MPITGAVKLGPLRHITKVMCADKRLIQMYTTNNVQTTGPGGLNYNFKGLYFLLLK